MTKTIACLAFQYGWKMEHSRSFTRTHFWCPRLRKMRHLFMWYGSFTIAHRCYNCVLVEWKFTCILAPPTSTVNSYIYSHLIISVKKLECILRVYHSKSPWMKKSSWKVEMDIWSRLYQIFTNLCESSVIWLLMCIIKLSKVNNLNSVQKSVLIVSTYNGNFTKC